jgi:hypothetical protein
MRILVLAILVLISCPTGHVSATPAFTVTRETCFERIYDAAHLTDHPQQRVRRIRLVARPHERGTITAGLDVWLRGSGVRYAAYAICRSDQGRTTCRSEFDDRVWRIGQRGAETVLVENGNIWLNPWDYDAEDLSDRGTRLGAKPDDGSWLLSAITCPKDPNN